MKKLKIEDLENALNWAKKSSPELKGIEIYSANKGRNLKVSLARIKPGSVNAITDFLSLSDMNQFLRGYIYKSENRLENK